MSAVSDVGFVEFIDEETVRLCDEQVNEVNEKVAKVYAYVAASLAATFASACVCAKMGFATTLYGSLPSTLFLLGVSIALLYASIRTSHETDSELKHACYGLFAAWEGLIISPLVLINAPAFAAAAITTVAITGGLGFAAMHMKQTFERYEKILLVALGALALASWGALFFNQVAAVMTHQIVAVGSMALFGTLVIYDTHKARSEALNPRFHPINYAIGIYLDAINIFVEVWKAYVRSQDN